MRSTRWFVLLSAVAATVPALGAEADQFAITTATVPLEITPEGRPAHLQIDPTLDPKLAAFLRQAIQGWEFEPATINGQPATARTTLSIRMSARVANADGDIRLQVDSATTGPAYATQKPPRYPMKALRTGQAGEVMVEAEISNDGRVLSTRIARSVAPKILEVAAIAAIKDWTFVPETVNGIPIATTALLPISFCIHGMHCPRLSPDGEPADTKAGPIAQSVVTLRTELAAR